MEASSRFDPQKWPGGEDDYFAFHIDLMGGNVANTDAMAKFATQENFSYKSFGAHYVGMLPKNAHADFLEYCPEAKHINHVLPLEG